MNVLEKYFQFTIHSKTLAFLLLSGILYQDEPVMISITNSTNDLNSTLQNLTTNSNITDIVTSSTSVSVTVL